MMLYEANTRRLPIASYLPDVSQTVIRYGILDEKDTGSAFTSVDKSG